MSFETHTSRYESRRQAHQRKQNGRGGGIIILMIILMGIFYAYFSVKGVGNVIVNSGTHTLEKGATLTSIPEAFGIDIGSTRYKLWTKTFAPNVKLQAGTYKITEDTTLQSLFEKTLTKPTYDDLTITILPGWNIYDIDAGLAEKKITKTGDILMAARDHFADLQVKYPFLTGRTSLEGFLYPDTYRILDTSDAYMIIDRLLGEWQKKIYPTYQSLGDKAYNELILASIVEREERVKSEQPIVAGILAKRVQEGIPMGADATVCYEYAKTQKQCTPDFIGSVITEKTAYNTRNKQGYPPTPISSISAATWESVLDKKDSPYYYYLHDTEGAIHYGKTLSEHNQNKATYLQ